MNRKRNNQIAKLYKFLKARHGHPKGQWSIWCKRPKTAAEKEQIIIEAILTQRTNWKNVRLAMANLKEFRLDSLKAIALHRNRNRFVLCMRPSGFYKQKSEYLISLGKFIIRRYGSVSMMAKEPAEKLRSELLNLKGIGPETADSILLYALEKPVFVIDEYTRRLLSAKGIMRHGANRKSPSASYEELRELFEKNLRRDFRLYQDFHALIVIDGKKHSANRR